MGRIVEFGRKGSTGVPNVRSLPYKTGEAIVRGSLVFKDANGELNLCGADPALIAGVALEAAASRPGYSAANNPAVVTGAKQEISIVIPDDETEFTARGVNGGTDPVIPLTTHLGETYGVANVSGEWVIDFADTTNTRVVITDIDTGLRMFWFKFLTANIQG